MTPKKLAQKLYRYYGSDAAVAEAVGVAQSTINRLRKGETVPRWSTYETLLAQAALIEDK